MHPTLVRLCDWSGRTYATERSAVKYFRRRPTPGAVAPLIRAHSAPVLVYDSAAKRPVSGVELADLRAERKNPSPLYGRDRGRRYPNRQAWRESRFTPEERSARRALRDAAYRRKLFAEIRLFHRARPRSLKAFSESYDAWEKQQHAHIRTMNLIAQSPEAKVQKGKLSLQTMRVADGPPGVLMPEVDAVTAESLGVKVLRWGKDWSVQVSARPTRFAHQAGSTTWKNGKVVKYHRANNTTYVRSLAVIRRPDTLECLFHETSFKLTLPPGFIWLGTVRSQVDLANQATQEFRHTCFADDLLKAREKGPNFLVEQYLARLSTHVLQSPVKSTLAADVMP